MLQPYDQIFGKTAVHNKFLAQEQADRCSQIQKMLHENGIQRAIADIAVEIGALPRERAQLLIKVINAKSNTRHPPLTTAPQSGREQSVEVALRAGRIDSQVRAECEKIVTTLAAAGYKHSFAQIFIEKGYAVRTPQKQAGIDNRKRSAPRSARPARRPAPPASRRLWMIGGGVAAALLILAIVLVSGRSPSQPPKPKGTAVAGAVVEKPKEKVPAPKTEPAPPKPAESEEDMRRAIEEGRKRVATEAEENAAKKCAEAEAALREKKWEEAVRHLRQLMARFGQTEFVKARKAEFEAKIRETEATERGEKLAVEKSAADAADAAKREAFGKLRERLAVRREEAKKNLETSRRELAVEKAQVAKAKAELRKRLETQKMILHLKTGTQLRNVTVLEATREDLRVVLTEGAARSEMSLSWDTVTNSSAYQVARMVWNESTAPHRFELGRFLIARRMWKEAREEFEKAAKLDAGLQKQVEEIGKQIDKVVAGQSSFKADTRRIGSTALLFTYTFEDEEQGGDWQSRQGQGKLKMEEGAVELEAKDRAVWTLKDVEFMDEIDVETTLSTDATMVVGFNWTWDGKGWILLIGKEGQKFLRRKEGGEDEIAKSDKVMLEPDKEQKVGVVVRGVNVKVFIGNTLAFEATDRKFLEERRKVEGTGQKPEPVKGWFALGVEKGKAVLRRKLSIQGKMDSNEIAKSFAEQEIFVRRALEGQLIGISEDEDLTSRWALDTSGEDEYFQSLLAPELREAFENGKRKLAQYFERGVAVEDPLPDLNKVILNAPGFPAAYYLRGLYYLRFRDPALARSDFQQARRADPEYFEALKGIAQVALNEYGFEDAMTKVDEAIAYMPDYAPAYALRGYLRYVTGDDSKTDEDLDLSLSLDPKGEEARTYQRNIKYLRRGPAELGAKHRQETPHFILMTDISPEKTKLYADRLEAAYAYFVETFKGIWKEDPKRRKPRVAVFNTREAYYTYNELIESWRGEWTAGVFRYLTNELLLFEDVDMDETLQTLYHEYFHWFMSRMVLHPPYWYNEGMAEYMGGITIENGKVIAKARILKERLKGLLQGVKEDHSLGFAEIMKQRPGEFYSGPVGFKYAQAWSMLHFFYNGAGGRYRPIIEGYFKQLLAGKDEEEAVDEAFDEQILQKLGVDIRKLEAEWKAYVRALPAPH